MKNSKKFNERKLLIFLYAEKVKRPITPIDLEYNQNITYRNACQRLSKMYLQGFLLRRSRGRYSLSKKGRRVLKKLKARRDKALAEGVSYSLNLRKRPAPVYKKYVFV